MLSPRTTCRPPSTTWSTPDCMVQNALIVEPVTNSQIEAKSGVKHGAHLAGVHARVGLIQIRFVAWS